jgi:transposase InsO family protein
VLDELAAIRGTPENIRSDNGSGFISNVIKESCEESGTNTRHIEPDFTTPAEARLLFARWRADYNHRRPQRALSKQTLADYAAKWEASAAQKLVQRMETAGNTQKAASIMTAGTS